MRYDGSYASQAFSKAASVTVPGSCELFDLLPLLLVVLSGAARRNRARGVDIACPVAFAHTLGCGGLICDMNLREQIMMRDIGQRAADDDNKR